MEPKSKLKPVKEFRSYKRNLPHFELPGSVYFITFTAAEGFTLSAEARDIVLASVKYGSGNKYRLYACVVMDTHVHLILQPLEETSGSFYSIARIMHGVKSYSANQLRKLSGKKGHIWLNESYDRVIRHDDEYLEKLNYIVNNPAKAGLVEKPEDYRWLYVAEADSG